MTHGARSPRLLIACWAFCWRVRSGTSALRVGIGGPREKSRSRRGEDWKGGSTVSLLTCQEDGALPSKSIVRRLPPKYNQIIVQFIACGSLARALLTGRADGHCAEVVARVVRSGGGRG